MERNDSAYLGARASRLRSCRFSLEREAARNPSEDQSAASSSVHAVRQLAFLHENVVSPRGGQGEGGGIRESDASAKVFRLEGQRALLRYLGSAATGKRLGAVRDRLRANLGDGDGPHEVESDCGGDPESLAAVLDEVFTGETMRALRAKQDQLRREEESALMARVGDENRRPPSPPEPRRTGGTQWRGCDSSDGAIEPRPTANYMARKRLAPSSPTDKHGRHPHPAQRDRRRERSKLPDRGQPDDGSGDDNPPAPVGATMFTSARQALCTNMSSPSKRNNYARTMVNQQQERKNKNNSNHASGAQWNAAPSHRMAHGAAKTGFVPPYVKKALESCGQGSPSTSRWQGKTPQGGRVPAKGRQGADEECPFSPKVMAMLLGHSSGGEIPEEITKLDAQLVEAICNDIMEQNGISWDDIVGQEDAKRLVKEMVVWPMLNPNLFKGARAPPKGLLLFGPPGTGKTLIGKAIASNIRATFFNISASSLTSKWIGEGEKMVRTLFTLAGHLQPAVIFIDEIDSILSARKSDGEHEASRRLKTEMLVQIEGCDPSSGERRVLIVGATNRPEELDEAARRRMPKQLYIPLPCAEARMAMVAKGICQVTHALSEADKALVVEKTRGYSGSDMKNFIQEACQGPVRDALSGREEAEVARLDAKDLRPVTLRDFKVASRAQRATVSAEEVTRYATYNAKHGTSYQDMGDGEDDEDW